MTLRRKTLLYVGLTIACFTAVLYALLSSILLHRLEALQREAAREAAERVEAAVRQDLETLDGTVGDWAARDDACAFVESGAPDFAERALSAEALQALRLSVAILLDAEGRICLARGYDLTADRVVSTFPSVRAYLKPGSPFLSHAAPDASRAGLVLLGEGPLLVASRPVVTSEKRGPIRGTLVFGRFLGEEQLDRLSRLTRASFRVERFDRPDLPPDFRWAHGLLAGGARGAVQPLDRQTEAAYFALRDVEGRPALLVRVDTPRTLYLQGLAGVRMLLGCVVALGAGLLCLSLAGAERLVLARLSRLAAAVSGIGSAADPGARVPVEGADEVAALARAINGMLEAVQGAVRFLAGAAGGLAEGSGALTRAAADVRGGADAQRRRCEAGAGKAREIEAAVEPLGALAGRLHQEALQSAEAVAGILGVTATVQTEMEGLCAGIEAASLSVRDLEDATSRVAAAATQVGAAAQSVAASAAAIDQANAVLRSGAGEGSELAAEVVARASAGRDSMAETESSMARIRQAVDAAVERFGRLGGELSRVGRVTQVIDDIAGRTNLLSLNAAIIAAQAGEHGRAFGVVATEIRTLAEKTAANTREIRAIVDGVVRGAGEAAEAVAEGADRVAEGADHVARTRTALDEIHRSSNHSAERLREIDEAARVQAAEASRVAGEIGEVSEGVVHIVGQVRAQEERTREIRRVLADVEGVARQTVRAADEQTRGTGSFAATMGTVSRASEEVEEAIAVVGELLTGLRQDLEALDAGARRELDRVAKLEGEGAALAAAAEGLRAQAGQGGA